MHGSPWATALMLAAGHALGDYGLQSEYMSRAKSPWDPLGAGGHWFFVLLAHSLIHGGIVALATGVPLLGAFEVVLHFGIDLQKSAGRSSYAADQAMHYLCKAAWLFLAATAPLEARWF